MKPFWISATIVLSLIINLRADAATILYNTTDIGRNYQILAGSGGQTYGIVGTTGITYAFDKSPTTSIYVNHFDFNYYQTTTLTTQSGSYQVGYATETGDNGHFFHPSFDTYSYTWYSTFGSPVSDVNIKGQVVGTSLNPFGPYGNFASPGNTPTVTSQAPVIQSFTPHSRLLVSNSTTLLVSVPTSLIT